MRLTFNYITDIYNKNKRYPKNSSYVSLFMVPNDTFDLNYFIFAACTKRDYSCPELIEVSKADYDYAKQFFRETENVEIGENLLNSREEILMLIYSIRDAVSRENKTIAEMLKLDDGGKLS